MEVFVGTSGWAYPWNKGGLDWYIRESGFNAVELNMSFYRLPFENMIRSWSVKGGKLRWIIKVNRMITHVYKFGGDSLEFWQRFTEIFKPLDSLIDFYLFQLPPSITPASLNLVEEFFKNTGLTTRIALEARNVEWFSDEYLDWAERLGVVFVSVDSPKLPLNVYKVNDIVYVRMHGRSAWYKHYYSEDELREVASKIMDLNPRRVYVFFNNDQGMLENGRRMMQLLK
ncbi:MAG: DUF72 domain-containing protein [Candidatus Odinarchaeum yellowstonii]|uniref:DUF72 domain-containing protein n=1 Tax=Odinarchaeota yellowstonii (strain LCB_4) TaxID=1841599 RepID=A0AAF0IAT9_ODILC|nr:MAG: DUF72 domain-containing protein [Candidatus Odinarchaeum yellowstonii]